MADRASECVAADATNTEKNRKGLPPELRHILPKNTLVFRVQKNQCEPQVAQGELLNAIWQRMAQLLDPPKTSTTPSETHWQQGTPS
jgi:1,2-phenylacetyl-CoA epoxidase catalytic subunit